MSADLKDRFSLDYLVSSQDEKYNKGWQDCKAAILKILKQDLQNADLSWETCDSRFIEKVEKL